MAFVSSLGYSIGSGRYPGGPSKVSLIQKAVCFDRKAEVYNIGYMRNEGPRTDFIYILKWKNRIIPFVLLASVRLIDRLLDRGFAHGRGLGVSVPIVSVPVFDVGVDLLTGRRGREYGADYDRTCFPEKKFHGFEFVSDEELQTSKDMIVEALTILLSEKYEQGKFQPSIPVEFTFGVGYWRRSDNFGRTPYQDLYACQCANLRRLDEKLSSALKSVRIAKKFAMTDLDTVDIPEYRRSMLKQLREYSINDRNMANTVFREFVENVPTVKEFFFIKVQMDINAFTIVFCWLE